MLRNINELKIHALNYKIYGTSNDEELSKLIESINARGILTPLLIAADGTIISGHRRYEAAKQCGFMSVPVYVSEVSDPLEIEEMLILANEQRTRTPEQKAREYAHLKKIEEQRAKERQACGQGGVLLQENLPEAKGESRDLAAAKVGWSGKTAEKAGQTIKVIDALEQGGSFEKAQEIRETLNQKSVDAAYKEAKPIIQQNPEIVKPKSEKISTFNATNDNIEWAKWTWNPVTGCKHGCPYCYAREIAMRFTGNFNPDFHEDRLNAPDNTNIPKTRENEPGIHNVFVCSMADLFGDWVPQEWIDAVIEQCRQSPKWNFLFLTKNPKRYIGIKWPDNAWVGTTIDCQKRVEPAMEAFRKMAEDGTKPKVSFISMEPFLEPVSITEINLFDWLIVGARSKTSRLPEFQPKWEWVKSVTVNAINSGVKVYWKPNLTVRPKEYPE